MLVKYRGKWAWQVGAGENRQRFSTGYPATRECRDLAERKAREIESALKRPQDETVGSIMDAYLEDLKDRAVDKDRPVFAWNRARAHFATLTPAQVTRPVCRSYVRARRADGVRDGTIIKELTNLRSGLRWFDKNTPAVIETPSAPPPRDRWLTREEFGRLLEAAAGVEHLTVFLHLAIATAGRKDAVLSLRWTRQADGAGWVDFDAGVVNLGVKANGKKRASVPMTDRLREVLQRARERGVSDFVVEYGGGRIADIKKAFNSAVADAGVEDFTIHDLRHTAAVWMAGAGVAMSKISQYLGHSSTSVTERIYARYAPDHLRDAASALEV